MKIRKYLICFLCALSSIQAIAHHSISPFDSSTVQEIEGVITSLSWRNPHLKMVLVVTNSDGVAEEWDIEGDAINTLMRRGLSQESFAVGQRITLAGYPSARGRLEMMPTNALLATGQEFLMLDADRPLRWTNPAEESDSAEEGATDIFRVWSRNTGYQRKGEFMLTDAAKAAMELYDPLIDTPSLRCIAPGMPNAILNPYPIEFVNNGDHILLRIEEWGAERIIDMISSEIPENAPPSRLGNSIGRFVGNTLEVRTAGFIDQLLDDDGIPMSNNAQLFERFTLVPDQNVLEYEVEVTDPVNLLEPAIWTLSKRWNPETIVRPFECNL